MYVYILTKKRNTFTGKRVKSQTKGDFEQPTWGFCQLNLGTKGGGTIPVRGYSMTRPVATI